MTHRLNSWLDQRNDAYSTLSGEDFTNRHVVLAHLTVIAILALMGVGELISRAI